jgi:hypothetical protein
MGRGGGTGPAGVTAGQWVVARPAGVTAAQ